MPYQAGKFLPGEIASKIGHIDAIESEVIKELLESFEAQDIPISDAKLPWKEIPKGEPLRHSIGSDGSLQPIPFEDWPYVKLSCVKTALVVLDKSVIERLGKSIPHPMELRDILSDSVISHVNIFPLRHVRFKSGITLHDAIRKISFDGMKKDPKLKDEVLKTLMWLAFEGWNNSSTTANFNCPLCDRQISISADTEIDKCKFCKSEIYITDWLGFHQRMGIDNVSEEIAKNYMNVHEMLLIFTKVRQLWEEDKEKLSECLFVKDGPLYLSDQFAGKLIPKIRSFLAFAKEKGNPVHMIGQEKTGAFFDHLQLISKNAPDNGLFIPDDTYIKEEIQQRPNIGEYYGKSTNFGAKVFLKLNQRDKFVLSVPTGNFIPNAKITDLIGIEKIAATIPFIQSRKFEGALLPVEIAHAQASISNYPSAKILKDYAESAGVTQVSQKD